jgi:hypothetical protein
MTLFVSNILILSVPDDHGQHHDFVCFQYFDHLSVPDDHGQHHDIGNKQSHDVDHDHQVHSRSKDWKQTKS